jgi:hypothetical protein
MGTIMGLCLVFCVFFFKPVDVVEGISLRARCSDGGVSDVGVGCGWLSTKGVGMFITDNTGMGLYFEEVDGRWWLADRFSNGLKDISLDVVAMEIRVWELLFDLVQWCTAVVCGYMWVAMYDCSCYRAASSAREMVLVIPMPFGYT